MKSKVTLKEILGTRIIFAVLIAFYYWMWARRDWNDYYVTIQNCVSIFTVVFFMLRVVREKKYRKEDFDELATLNLKRCDALCLKIAVLCMIVIAWMGALELFTGRIMGYLLVYSIIVIAVIRTIVFSVMDSKGV